MEKIVIIIVASVLMVLSVISAVEVVNGPSARVVKESRFERRRILRNKVS